MGPLCCTPDHCPIASGAAISSDTPFPTSELTAPSPLFRDHTHTAAAGNFNTAQAASLSWTYRSKRKGITPVREEESEEPAALQVLLRARSPHRWSFSEREEPPRLFPRAEEPQNLHPGVQQRKSPFCTLSLVPGPDTVATMSPGCWPVSSTNGI